MPRCAPAEACYGHYTPGSSSVTDPFVQPSTCLAGNTASSSIGTESLIPNRYQNPCRGFGESLRHPPAVHTMSPEVSQADQKSYILTSGAVDDLHELLEWSRMRWGKELTKVYLRVVGDN